jgi:hypothetical protein
MPLLWVVGSSLHTHSQHLAPYATPTLRGQFHILPCLWKAAVNYILCVYSVLLEARVVVQSDHKQQWIVFPEGQVIYGVGVGDLQPQSWFQAGWVQACFHVKQVQYVIVRSV